MRKDYYMMRPQYRQLQILQWLLIFLMMSCQLDALAILNTDLRLTQVIPLDEMQYRIGLLKDVYNIQYSIVFQDDSSH